MDIYIYIYNIQSIYTLINHACLQEHSISHMDLPVFFKGNPNLYSITFFIVHIFEKILFILRMDNKQVKDGYDMY
jgi:hypothetical protein